MKSYEEGVVDFESKKKLSLASSYILNDFISIRFQPKILAMNFYFKVDGVLNNCDFEESKF